MLGLLNHSECFAKWQIISSFDRKDRFGIEPKVKMQHVLLKTHYEDVLAAVMGKASSVFFQYIVVQYFIMLEKISFCFIFSALCVKKRNGFF